MTAPHRLGTPRDGEHRPALALVAIAAAFALLSGIAIMTGSFVA